LIKSKSLFLGTKENSFIYKFSFIFAMKYIIKLYELHDSSTENIPQSIGNKEYNQDRRGITHDTTCDFHTA
jgi:hypothetical protein